MTEHRAAQDNAGAPTWERRLELLSDYSAYVLLAFGLALVMAQPLSQQDRVIAVLLSVVAAAWITLYLRVPRSTASAWDRRCSITTGSWRSPR